MERLRCLSPALLHREVLMHLIAYNLIRGIMAEAAAIYDQDVARLSFKGSVPDRAPLQPSYRSSLQPPQSRAIDQ